VSRPVSLYLQGPQGSVFCSADFVHEKCAFTPTKKHVFDGVKNANIHMALHRWLLVQLQIEYHPDWFLSFVLKRNEHAKNILKIMRGVAGVEFNGLWL